MNTFTRLYLVRHGQVVNHAAGVYNGHNDIELSELGVRQMESVAERLRHENLMAVYCSDLIRSRSGGEWVAREHGLDPHPSPTLRELNFGLWAGLTFMEIEENYPGALEVRSRDLIHFRPPEGESVEDMQRRVLPTVRSIMERHRGGRVALVAHGGVNRVILADAMRLDAMNVYSIDQEYGCLNIIDYYRDLAVIKLINGRPRIDY